MAITFIVEDGTGKSDANALITTAEADGIMANYGDSADWKAASDGDDGEKAHAIREATRYLNFHYTWLSYKTLGTQACQWPRFEVYDEDGYSVDSDVIPERVKEACAYLALQVIEGDTLLEDFDNSSRVKKTKDVIGPITEEREYVAQGESPEKTYQIADRLVTPFVSLGAYFGTDLERG